MSKILVIDDEAILRDAVAEALRRAGHAVEAFDSGRPALDAFAQGGADLVISDFKMPGMDGVAVLAEAKRIAPDVPFIIVTAHERRRFVPKVDFVTSPAWLEGGDSRRRSGLMFGGVSRVVTTLGVFGFEPETRRMRVEALHPGVTREHVQDHTGFALLDAPEITRTAPPAADELEMLRALDPERRFLG